MIKKDLLKQLENVGDDVDVNETLLALDEYKNLGQVDLTKLTAEDYKKLLETNPVVKAYHQSSFDSAVGTAVTKHDQKFMKEKFPELLKAEMEKVNNKSKTPEQIEAEKALAEARKLRDEVAHEKMINKYTKILTDKKLPVELADYVVGKDEETSNKNVEFFNSLFGKVTEENLKSNAAKPPAGNAGKIDADTQALMSVMGLDSAPTE